MLKKTKPLVNSKHPLFFNGDLNCRGIDWNHSFSPNDGIPNVLFHFVSTLQVIFNLTSYFRTHAHSLTQLNADKCNPDVKIVGFDLVWSDARFLFFNFYRPQQYDSLSRNRDANVLRKLFLRVSTIFHDLVSWDACVISRCYSVFLGFHLVWHRLLQLGVCWTFTVVVRRWCHFNEFFMLQFVSWSWDHNCTIRWQK